MYNSSVKCWLFNQQPFEKRQKILKIHVLHFRNNFATLETLHSALTLTLIIYGNN
jgi:hypothetical protein